MADIPGPLLNRVETSVAVAICTYNNAALLARSLSALEQQRVASSCRWTAIVIDNNSQDETPLVVQEYIRRGVIPGLRYMREKRQGQAFARQRAVRESNEELIAFVDDDCL